MEPVRLGIIGCGVISHSHLDLAAKCPLARVVATADIVPERARALAEKYGIPAYYGSAEELLADEKVEAVILAMPTGVRGPIAYRALEKGKHVLLEKPVANCAEEVEKMIAMQGDRVVACCSSRTTFTGDAEAAARCVASGVLNEIRLVRIRAVLTTPREPNPNPPPWRQSMKLNGGGILVNWSCYDLNYMLHIVGWQLEPKMVLAQWWPVAQPMAAYVAPGSDADSHYIALIRCAKGIVLSMERGEFTSAVTDQAWEIIGTHATLHLPMRPQPGKPNAVLLDKFVPGKGVIQEVIWHESRQTSEKDVVSDFVNAIRTGSEPRTDLRRSLVLQKITDAIYASAASGTCVEVA